MGFSALWSSCLSQGSQGQAPGALVYPQGGDGQGGDRRALCRVQSCQGTSLELISSCACLPLHTCTHAPDAQSSEHREATVFLLLAAQGHLHHGHPAEVLSLLVPVYLRQGHTSPGASKCGD